MSDFDLPPEKAKAREIPTNTIKSPMLERIRIGVNIDRELVTWLSYGSRFLLTTLRDTGGRRTFEAKKDINHSHITEHPLPVVRKGVD